MKKKVILGTFAAALMLSAFTSVKNDSTSPVAITEVAPSAKGRAYDVDVTKSEVKWHAKKIAGEHLGNINLSSGQLTVDNNKVTGGTFIVDMKTITCTDLTDEGSNARLVNHLKSDDFFSIEKHPAATFQITSVNPVAKAEAGKPNYNVEGNLTIKGITNPVSFPATIAVKNGVATAKADVTVDRTKYDIKYRSSNFFENLGDKAIYDEFTVSFNITAKQQSL